MLYFSLACFWISSAAALHMSLQFNFNITCTATSTSSFRLANELGACWLCTLTDAHATTIIEVTKHLAAITRHIRALEVLFLMSIPSRTAWEATLSKVSRCHHVLYETVRALENVHKDNRLGGQVYVDLHVYRHTASELTDKHRSKSNVANLSVALIRSVVFIGVLALVVGLLCYLESQQPLGVWITAFVVLGVLCALFVWLFISSFRT